MTYNIHHGALCLLRVYALYGRSRRILGLLFFLGMTLCSRDRHPVSYPRIFSVKEYPDARHDTAVVKQQP